MAIFCFVGMAASPPSPRRILAKAKASMGGSAWDRIRSIRSTGTLETSGLRGTIETLEDLSSGAHVTRYDLGAIRGMDGFDGHTVWLEDSTGQIYPQGHGTKRMEAANAAYLACRGYWFPKRWPADVAWMGRRKELGRAYEVLQITPRGGQPFEFWVDAQTGCLNRTMDFKEGETDTTRFADYREVQGVKLPFDIREGRGEAQFDSVMRLTQVTLNQPLRAQAFTMPIPSSKDCGFVQGLTSTTMPIEIEPDGHVYLQASLDGKGPFWFCLDSGVEGSMLTPAVAKQLGLKAEGAVALKGVGAATESASFLTVNRTQFTGAWVDGLTFSVSPSVGMIGEVHGEPCAGIFGSDLLQRFVVRIEYAAHRLSLFSAQRWRYRGHGVAVPFVFRGQIPQVEGKLDGMPGTFAIDTGSGGTLDVFAPFVAAHHLIAKAGLTYPNPEGDRGFGGETQSRLTRFRELRLGTASMARPIVGLSTMNQGAFAGREGLGNVGAGFFKHFDVTFDYRRQRIYFEPNANHDAPDRFGNTHGLRGLEGDKNGFRIMDLLQPSPLSEVGVKVGDVIVSINGKAGRDLTPGVLGEALGGPVGSLLDLEIQADGKIRHVTLTLRDLL
jgi:hypothetical protein